MNNIITNILPEPSDGFRPKVALTTCMSSWKFFSKVVSRDLMVFSMLRESWFTFTITGLSIFLVGSGDAFDPVETLLSSTVADTITVTQNRNRINHMIRDECILKGNPFTNYLPLSDFWTALCELPLCKCSLNMMHFPASYSQPITLFHIFFAYSTF